MTELEILTALNCIDIGFKRYQRLLQYFKTTENILKASLRELTQVQGIGEELGRRILSIKKEDLAAEFRSAEKLGLRIISINDKDYPRNLKEIYEPPIILYVKGEFIEADLDSIAIVGSRRASFYGLNCAEKFARDLSILGLTVVSGMARGVDTAAHKGALKENGRTIAVMGSGFKNIYPVENKELVEEIAASGAVISEFPTFAQPLPQNFPRRNRIISGLSQGVLVVEAARNSGALITADFALEQGREVFSLPGKIDAEN
ncbi:MAG: DNA-processing protein DprA, partial [Candidatus Omnitrophica bacterium]|nr:DNA-processing protein DprA [Candidatus Omnitrophota bacterium]